jgi:hypothetical protein
MLKSPVVCNRLFVKMEEASRAQEENVNQKSVKVSETALRLCEEETTSEGVF